MSNLLKKKYALASLRAELERRLEKLCYGCKKFGHLACKTEEKGKRGHQFLKIDLRCY